jgi:hypothetical protein
VCAEGWRLPSSTELQNACNSGAISFQTAETYMGFWSSDLASDAAGGFHYVLENALVPCELRSESDGYTFFARCVKSI